MKIVVDFSVSTITYFFIGYGVAYGIHFFSSADARSERNAYESAKFYPQLAATAVLAGFAYPLFEGMHEIARSAFTPGLNNASVPASMILPGRWRYLVRRLGRPAGHHAARYKHGCYGKDGAIAVHPSSSVPFLSMGAWIQAAGWFGFNGKSAQTLDGMNGAVTLNSLIAMTRETLVALALGRNDPGFVCHGPLAGTVAVCAGSDLAHLLSADPRRHLRADVHRDEMQVENRRPARCVAAAWPVRRLGQHCGRHPWNRRWRQRRRCPDFLIDRYGHGVTVALVNGLLIYDVLNKRVDIRLDPEQELDGNDLAMRRI